MTVIILAGILMSPHIDPPPPVPLLVNPYYPPFGGINCMEPCTHFGNGVEIQEWHYSKRMACAPQHIGCEFRIWNDYFEIGPIWCVESGGALLEPIIHDGELVQLVDILHRLVDDDGERIPDSELPIWNHAVTDTYEIDCNWHE
jgi:hypothetical protein